jgi:uncharacterized membrane protein
MWIIPALAVIAGWIAVIFLTRFEASLGWRTSVSPDNARTVMSTVAASMFTLVVVVCSALLVAVQLASAQLTPRIITFIYRGTSRKLSIAVFAFTFTFSISYLVRIGESVPMLTGYLAAYGFFLNLILFLYFIDSMGKALRPSSALGAVASVGREVIKTVYPRRLDEKQIAQPENVPLLDTEPSQVVTSLTEGVVLAFDVKGVVSLAQQSNCIIHLEPEVGDFIAVGDPLFQVFGGHGDLSEETLRRSVALGPERTFEQDPMFAFRIIVDVASKALSPAVNDPTTAVLAIDQIDHLLRDVGNRYLAEGRESDALGRVRIIYRTPNWEDFVRLSVTEIRHYGRDSIQVVRRLRAMFETLIETLPERRAPALIRELRLLETAAKRSFQDLDDQVLAETGDMQGLGGGQFARKHVRAQSEQVGSITRNTSAA